MQQEKNSCILPVVTQSSLFMKTDSNTSAATRRGEGGEGEGSSSEQSSHHALLLLRYGYVFRIICCVYVPGSCRPFFVWGPVYGFVSRDTHMILVHEEMSLRVRVYRTVSSWPAVQYGKDTIKSTRGQKYEYRVSYSSSGTAGPRLPTPPPLFYICIRILLVVHFYFFVFHLLNDSIFFIKPHASYLHDAAGVYMYAYVCITTALLIFFYTTTAVD